MAKTSYPTVTINEDGWSEWLRPNPTINIACCSCSLVHQFEFTLSQPGNIIMFRVKRDNRATSALRRKLPDKLKKHLD